MSHNTSNVASRDDLMKDVREFGRAEASGKDALPMLAHRVVRATVDGVLTLDKDSDGKDDAYRVYEEYQKAASRKAVHEHTKVGVKANASKVRQFIVLGGMTTCDPVDVMNRAKLVRDQMIADEQKVKPAYSALLDVAREQTKTDRALTDDEIKALTGKAEPDEKTVEGELTKVYKVLDKLVTGEGGLKDTDQFTVAAHQAVGQRLAALKFAREKEEILLKAGELGLKIEEPQVEAEIAEAA